MCHWVRETGGPRFMSNDSYTLSGVEVCIYNHVYLISCNVYAQHADLTDDKIESSL